MLNFKAKTVVDDYMHVYIDDPAIDQNGNGWRKDFDAALQMNDYSRLPVRPSEKPTIFWLRHPTGKLRRYILDLIQDSFDRGDVKQRQQHATAFELVKHLLVKVDDTGLDSFDTDPSRDPQSKFPVIKPVTMDILDSIDGGELINDLAVRIYTELTPDPQP
jgi:hypothetical protein